VRRGFGLEEEFILKRREETAIWKFGDKLMRAAIVVLIFGTAAILWVEVTGRIIHHNWTGYEEILTMTVFWLYMFGCAYCSREDTHIKADIVSVLMKECLAKRIIECCRWILTTVLCFILMIWAISLIQWDISQGNETYVYRLPVWIGDISMVFGFGISSIYNVIYTIDSFRKLIGKPRDPEVREDELAEAAAAVAEEVTE